MWMTELWHIISRVTVREKLKKLGKQKRTWPDPGIRQGHLIHYSMITVVDKFSKWFEHRNIHYK